MSQPAGQRARRRGEQPPAAVESTSAAGWPVDPTADAPPSATRSEYPSEKLRRKRPEPRRARVYVTRLDPWSVAKAAFLLSLAIGIVIVVAFSFVFWTLDSTGTLDAVSRTIDDVLGTGGFDLLTSLELSRVLGLAAVIASVEIVLVSALATLFAFLYNVTVGLTGGIEVVLSDN